jgi:hypothetical protein
MKLVSAKRVTVPSLNGSIILFMPGQPVEVSERDVRACKDRGCVPADKVEAVVETMDRIEEITNAIQTLLDEGDESNFTSMGDPKVKPIERILGYDITASERDAAWKSLSGE